MNAINSIKELHSLFVLSSTRRQTGLLPNTLYSVKKGLLFSRAEHEAGVLRSWAEQKAFFKAFY